MNEFAETNLGNMVNPLDFERQLADEIFGKPLMEGLRNPEPFPVGYVNITPVLEPPNKQE